MTSIVAVTGPQEHLVFDTRADLLTLWAHRSISDSSDPTTLLAILKTISLLPGTFVWIAADRKQVQAQCLVFSVRNCVQDPEMERIAVSMRR